MNNNKPNTFYYWLDPLRALAALLVLFVHTRSVMFEIYSDLMPASQNIFTTLFFFICSLGGFSVCIFYILSGFLVGGRTIEKLQKGTASPRKFFLDRAFRIGVPLTGALVLIAIINTITGQGIDWYQLIGQYFGLQCVLTLDYGGVFWTLPYEIWFYAILLAIILIVRRKKHTILGILLFMLSIIVFCKLIPQFLYILTLGIICFSLKDYRLSAKTKRVLWLFFAISFCVYFIFNLHFATELLGITEYVKKLRGTSQVILFTFIALILSQYVTYKPSSKISITVNNVGNKLAVFSYSLYLTHYQILKLWIAYMPKFDTINIISISSFVAMCLTCLVVAYIFYFIFEKRSRNIQTLFERLIGSKKL